MSAQASASSYDDRVSEAEAMARFEEADRYLMAAQLRREAVEAVQRGGVVVRPIQIRLGSAQRRAARPLSEILKEVGDPRLLDIPQDEGEWPATLLEHAIEEGAVKCAKLLIESGADPTKSRLVGGLLPVHLLAYRARFMTEKNLLRFVDLLGQAGADFDAKDADGWTALHYAIDTGSSRMAKILLDRGAWIDPKLLDDPDMEAKLTAVSDDPGSEDAEDVLREVRAIAMERHLLSAMPAEPAAAPQSPGMTL